MDRKEICEFLVQNDVPGELMAYKDYGDQGCVAIASNGMKFKFTADYLAQAEPKAKAAMQPAPKKRAPAKRKTTTRKKPAAKKATK